MDTISIVIGLVAGLVGGGLIGSIVLRKRVQKQSEYLLKDAEADAEVIKKVKILQAKEKFLQLKEEHEKLIKEKNKKIEAAENRIKQKEGSLNQKLKDLSVKERENDRIQSKLNQQLEFVEKKQNDLKKSHKKITDQLSSISNLKPEEAKQQLMENMKDEAKTESMSYIQNIMDEAKINANKEARKIVIQTIQRVATEQTIENSVTVFHIESDQVKGKIIGREGRNIRAIEAATGVELIVDDTPEAVLLSCFDPVRREIARLSLHQLVTDGRIHPARVEEVVSKIKKQLSEEIIETGKRTCIDLGIHGLHPKLIETVGRMKYRSSYGQNLLQHSREVANLCAIMATELGLNPKIAKRAGLLHDIGKVPHEDEELPHALLGMKWAEKYKERKEVCNAIGAHHDEIEMKSLYAPIVQVCDAVSGARPGARREIMESYIKRLQDLEGIALGFNGVVKAYAIQAGRELRVMVESEKVPDEKAAELSFEISQKIQNEMTYPGQVKITVIRETRAVNYAK